MTTKNNSFFKLWGAPILLGAMTCLGLILAIIGTGIWHALSWIALIIPVYAMIKYGLKFFGW